MENCLFDKIIFSEDHKVDIKITNEKDVPIFISSIYNDSIKLKNAAKSL